MNFNLSFLLLADSGSALCGFLPAVADLLQGSICGAFRDAPLHPLAVTSTYLCYCCLLSKQCTHSPQTSGINKGIFTQRTTARLIFSLFHTIVCKTQTLAGCAENPPSISAVDLMIGLNFCDHVYTPQCTELHLVR